jgi:type I restriction enzyme S subunit
MSFQRYPKYKDSGVEWLGDVPEHWGVTALKRGFNVTLGKMLQPESSGPEDERHFYLRAANIQWAGVDAMDIKQMWFSKRDRAQLRLEKGDLLVSEGGDVGRSCLWEAELEECYFQNSVNRVRARGKHSNSYLCYWMSTIKEKGYVDVLCNKSTIAHFTAEKVSAVPIPLPPPEDQTAIAAFLDRETAKIDELVAEQRRLMKLLKEKRQAVISHAVTQGLNPDAPMKPSGIEWLGELPENWEVKRIKHVVVRDGIQIGPFGGMLLDLSAEDTGFKVFGQENTISGDFTLGGRWVDESRFRNLVAYHAVSGDLLLTRKGSLGNARLIHDLPQPGIIDSDTIRIRVEPSKIIDRLLALLMHEAPYIEQQVTQRKRGAILAGVNSETIANLTIALPPLTEQIAIMRHLDSELAKFDTLTLEAQRAIDLLQERRTALISAAVTGQIDVREEVSQ